MAVWEPAWSTPLGRMNSPESQGARVFTRQHPSVFCGGLCMGGMKSLVLLAQQQQQQSPPSRCISLGGCHLGQRHQASGAQGQGESPENACPETGRVPSLRLLSRRLLMETEAGQCFQKSQPSELDIASLGRPESPSSNQNRVQSPAPMRDRVSSFAFLLLLIRMIKLRLLRFEQHLCVR